MVGKMLSLAMPLSLRRRQKVCALLQIQHGISPYSIIAKNCLEQLFFWSKIYCVRSDPNTLAPFYEEVVIR
jgi:hypothetical protein